MSWDTPESGAPDHYFLEMTNLTTGKFMSGTTKMVTLTLELSMVRVQETRFLGE